MKKDANSTAKREPETEKPARTSWWVGVPQEGWTAHAQAKVGGKFASDRLSGENFVIDRLP